jgi:hypothetical protein
MHTVKLSVNSRTSVGGAHTSLIIDGQDTGVLYLNPEEKDILVQVLQAGARELDSVVFQQEEPESEVDFDIFDD